ncbi:MAG: gfo/Idh/MocA family oxidoreductase, partial [Nitrospirae bacterium]
MISISLIGAGYLGRFHALNLSELEGIRFAGIYDINKQRAQEVAQEADTEVFESLDEAIGSSNALVIASPTTTHYEIALRAIHAGRDVFIEKPITSTIEEAESLISEAEKGGRIIQVGHLERFNPAVMKATEMLEEPVFYEAERLSPFLGRGTDVDITLDLMIHDIDIILAITGSKVKEIRAVGARVLTDNVDVAKAWLVFENSAQACLTASRLSHQKRRVLRVFQDNGMIEIDYQKPMLTVYGKENSGIEKREFLFDSPNPLREELRDFVDAIKKRRSPLVNAEQALEAMK